MRAALSGLSGVTVHPRLTDRDLLNRYQRAGVFLLALEAASGSNALLQALACGCPTVVTDVPSVQAFLPNSHLRTSEPGDGEGHLRAVLDLLNGETTPPRQSLESYSLRATAQAHREVYRSLAGTA